MDRGVILLAIQTCLNSYGGHYKPIIILQLAAGLDKYRTDASLLIWDVNRIKADPVYSTPQGEASEMGAKHCAPIHEYGMYMSVYAYGIC